MEAELLPAATTTTGLAGARPLHASHAPGATIRRLAVARSFSAVRPSHYSTAYPGPGSDRSRVTLIRMRRDQFVSDVPSWNVQPVALPEQDR